MQLSQTKPGQVVTVVSVQDTPAAARLQAIGFVAGTSVRVGRRAPLGDPTLYEFRGARFALRKATAALVEVALVEVALVEVAANRVRSVDAAAVDVVPVDVAVNESADV
jgi:ferrous iron transport protein A